MARGSLSVNRRKNAHGMVSLVAMTIVIQLTITFAPLPAAATAGTVRHLPIYIATNADFTAANGVTGGSGTATDPYIIEGWNITHDIYSGSATIGIEITANAYYLIRNVLVQGFSVGIFLSGTQGQVVNSTITGNGDGIDGGVTVRGNTVYGNRVGIRGTAYAAYAEISGNIVFNNFKGISVEGSSARVLGNYLNNNSQGIVMVSSQDLARDNLVISPTVENEAIDANPNPDCTCEAYSGANITHNIVVGGRIGVYSSQTVRITDNVLRGGQDLNVRFSSFVTAFHNTFLDDSPVPYYYATTLDSGYPGGGNYWSHYHGVDNCSGIFQDVCMGPDGIGDTPYTPDSYTYDRYPLMQPWGLLATFPYPFTASGSYNTSMVVGLSQPHAPAGAANTIDVVGAIPVAASMATQASVGLPSASLDIEAATSNGTAVTTITRGGNIMTFGGRGSNWVTRYFVDRPGPLGLPVRVFPNSGVCTTNLAGAPVHCYRRQVNATTGAVTDYGDTAVLYDRSVGRFVVQIAGLSGYASQAEARLVAQHGGTVLSGTGTITRLVDANGDGVYEAYQVIDGTGGFVAMVSPQSLALPGDVKETMVVGYSEPHGVAGAASTIDVVGGIPLAVHETRTRGGTIWAALDIFTADPTATAIAPSVGDLLSIGGRGVNLVSRYYNASLCIRFAGPSDGTGKGIYDAFDGVNYRSQSLVLPYQSFALNCQIVDGSRRVEVVAGLSGYSTRATAEALAMGVVSRGFNRGIVVSLVDYNGDGTFDVVGIADVCP